MKTLDLTKMKLPLTQKKFKKLRAAIKTKRVKWMDMSVDMMYAYQDFWRYLKHRKSAEMYEE